MTATPWTRRVGPLYQWATRWWGRLPRLSRGDGLAIGVRL